ncbi:MAG: bifunctional DNA-binding transcriptional regulator/O6-methylguanine-DNA methyltransferase Ada [Thalassobaculales bacterium]
MLDGTVLDDARWQAVAARDKSAEGRFVMAVRTTGIFCKPGCPARLPKRENVIFFATPAEARAAGFRPCLRCKPDAAGRDGQVGAVGRACRILDEAEEAPTLEALGRAVGVSPFHLQRLFKKHLGISPREYVDARRTQRLKTALHDGEPVAEAVFGAGYGSTSRVYGDGAAARLGMTPAAYRRGGAGEAIFWSVSATPLGPMAVAATERGLCFLGFTDDPADGERAVREEFPAAALQRDDGVLKGAVDAVVAYLEGRAGHPDLPLDTRATAFQRQVWQHLQTIPLGETSTYSRIAAALGNPRAVRAVARACATNPVSVVVPCHRVLREDGSLAGYRWGLERKRALLDREAGD